MDSHKEIWLKLDMVNRIMNFHRCSKILELFDVLNGLNTNNIQTDCLLYPAVFQLFA